MDGHRGKRLVIVVASILLGLLVVLTAYDARGTADLAYRSPRKR